MSEQKPNFEFEDTIGDKKLIIKCEGEVADDMELMNKSLVLMKLFREKAKRSDD